MNKIVAEIIKWLKIQLIESKKVGFVLGISGGIDSTVLYYILKEGHFKFIAIHVDYDKELSNSEKKCLSYLNQFKDSHIMNISAYDIFKQYEKIFIKNDFKNDSLISIESTIKARIRENIFYSYSKIYDLLVLGSINKVEFNIGYFVKNSSIGDLLPFADMDKKSIRKLAKHFNLPNEIIIAKASGCNGKLYAEEEWGISETTLDDIINNNSTPSLSKKTLIKYNQYHKTTEHKRNFPIIFKL